jgi:hypothetical protein
VVRIFPRGEVQQVGQGGQVHGDRLRGLTHLSCRQLLDLPQAVEQRVAVDMEPLGRPEQVEPALAPGDQRLAQGGPVGPVAQSAKYRRGVFRPLLPYRRGHQLRDPEIGDGEDPGVRVQHGTDPERRRRMPVRAVHAGQAGRRLADRDPGIQAVPLPDQIGQQLAAAGQVARHGVHGVQHRVPPGGDFAGQILAAAEKLPDRA